MYEFTLIMTGWFACMTWRAGQRAWVKTKAEMEAEGKLQRREEHEKNMEQWIDENMR